MNNEKNVNNIKNINFPFLLRLRRRNQLENLGNVIKITENNLNQPIKLHTIPKNSALNTFKNIYKVQLPKVRLLLNFNRCASINLSVTII